MKAIFKRYIKIHRESNFDGFRGRVVIVLGHMIEIGDALVGLLSLGHFYSNYHSYYFLSDKVNAWVIKGEKETNG